MVRRAGASRPCRTTYVPPAHSSVARAASPTRADLDHPPPSHYRMACARAEELCRPLHGPAPEGPSAGGEHASDCVSRPSRRSARFGAGAEEGREGDYWGCRVRAGVEGSQRNGFIVYASSVSASERVGVLSRLPDLDLAKWRPQTVANKTPRQQRSAAPHPACLQNVGLTGVLWLMRE